MLDTLNRAVRDHLNYEEFGSRLRKILFFEKLIIIYFASYPKSKY